MNSRTFLLNPRTFLLAFECIKRNANLYSFAQELLHNLSWLQIQFSRITKSCEARNCRAFRLSEIEKCARQKVWSRLGLIGSLDFMSKL